MGRILGGAAERHTPAGPVSAAVCRVLVGARAADQVAEGRGEGDAAAHGAQGDSTGEARPTAGQCDKPTNSWIRNANLNDNK